MHVVWIVFSNMCRDLVKDSFEYRYNMFGYSAWLSLADGTETNREKIIKLKVRGLTRVSVERVFWERGMQGESEQSSTGDEVW